MKHRETAVAVLVAAAVYAVAVAGLIAVSKLTGPAVHELRVLAAIDAAVELVKGVSARGLSELLRPRAARVPRVRRAGDRWRVVEGEPRAHRCAGPAHRHAPAVVAARSAGAALALPDGASLAWSRRRVDGGGAVRSHAAILPRRGRARRRRRGRVDGLRGGRGPRARDGSGAIGSARRPAGRWCGPPSAPSPSDLARRCRSGCSGSCP